MNLNGILAKLIYKKVKTMQNFAKKPCLNSTKIWKDYKIESTI